MLPKQSCLCFTILRSQICRCVDGNFFPRDLNAAQRVVSARTSTSRRNTHTHICTSHNSVRQGISAFTFERRTPRIFFRTNIIRLEPSAEPSAAAVKSEFIGAARSLMIGLGHRFSPPVDCRRGLFKGRKNVTLSPTLRFIYLFLMSKLSE